MILFVKGCASRLKRNFYHILTRKNYLLDMFNIYTIGTSHVSQGHTFEYSLTKTDFLFVYISILGIITDSITFLCNKLLLLRRKCSFFSTWNLFTFPLIKSWLTYITLLPRLDRKFVIVKIQNQKSIKLSYNNIYYKTHSQLYMRPNYQSIVPNLCNV